ncbi:MAG: hypothetical protein IT336_15940, partial [Thermomicrobiales bacterium]|nr:hypothetical protein [Thermomicrobiales bacterium]
MIRALAVMNELLHRPDCWLGRIVDFVVAGFGFGALMVVVGFIVRDVGPLLWRRTGTDTSNTSQEASGRWRALCHGISGSLTAGGVLIILVTVVAVAAGLSDSVGSTAVLVAAVIGVAIAAALSARTFRGYRHGQLRVSPVREATRRERPPVNRGLSKQSTGPLPTVARQSPKPNDEAATTPAVVAAEPPPDEPFDVNKLLPEEF